MKTDETTKHGDISPISGSISNLAEQGKASTSKSGRKTEPSFERLQNYSRVTPAQLAYVTFPPESRYQPVRPVSTKPSTRTKGAKSSVITEGFAGVGGILIMIDQRPDEEAEFIEALEPSVLVSATTPAPGTVSRPNIGLGEGPEADPPEPFEVRLLLPLVFVASNKWLLHSILSVAIHRACVLVLWNKKNLCVQFYDLSRVTYLCGHRVHI